MRKLFLTTVSAFLASVPFVGAVMPTENPADSVIPQLTLDQCIAVALSESPTLKIADLEIERIDYSKKDVLAQLLPTVSFGGTYNRMIAKQVAYMNFDLSGLGGGDGSTPDNETIEKSRKSGNSKDDGFKMGLDNSYQVGFNASAPLIAPQLWASMSLS
ncbi:MAG: TolC family protein, partial [Muribaculaceae bacterium]|nr:TolC family protein [Muribaculaceae bacterium]